MVKLNVPADFDLNRIEQYNILNRWGESKKIKIDSFYGGLSPSPFPSARYQAILPKVSLKQLEKYVAALHKNGYYFNYTFNGICFGNREHTPHGENAIKKFLTRINETGIDNITVANFKVIDIIRSNFPRLKVHLSTSLQIANAVSIRELEKRGGVDRIILSSDVNKNFGILADIIKNSKTELEIILNSTCFLACPYAYSHYSFISHTNADFEFGPGCPAYFESNCGLNKLRHPTDIICFSPFIRPEDVIIYHDNLGIVFFKMIGRHKNGRDHLKNISVYMQGGYGGNFFELFDGFQPGLHADAFFINNKNMDGIVDELSSRRIDFCRDYKKYIKIAKKAAQGMRIDKKKQSWKIRQAKKSLTRTPAL